MDYSKIDFTKLKLPALPCPMANGTTVKLGVCAYWDHAHSNIAIKVGNANEAAVAKTGHGPTGWQLMLGAAWLTTDDILQIIRCTELVDVFVAHERSAEPKPRPVFERIRGLVPNDAEVDILQGLLASHMVRQ